MSLSFPVDEVWVISLADHHHVKQKGPSSEIAPPFQRAPPPNMTKFELPPPFTETSVCKNLPIPFHQNFVTSVLLQCGIMEIIFWLKNWVRGELHIDFSYAMRHYEAGRWGGGGGRGISNDVLKIRKRKNTEF